MRKLKLIGSETYTCHKMEPDTISKGQVGTFEDDDAAEKVMANTYVDRRGEEVPYFEDVTGSDPQTSEDGDSAAPAKSAPAKRSRAA